MHNIEIPKVLENVDIVNIMMITYKIRLSFLTFSFPIKY